MLPRVAGVDAGQDEIAGLEPVVVAGDAYCCINGRAAASGLQRGSSGRAQDGRTRLSASAVVTTAKTIRDLVMSRFGNR